MQRPSIWDIVIDPKYKVSISTLRRDPMWRKYMPDRPSKKSLCPVCSFPSVSMRDKRPYIDNVLCPFCGYPENGELVIA